MMAAEPIDIPADWEAALARAGAADRVAVIGPPDAGKSTFLHALAARRAGLGLIDLDPGQKMIGPPGTAGAGRLGSPSAERFVFLGSTAVGSFRDLAAAGGRLAAGLPAPFAVNTPGYVRGPGARLQAMLLDAVRPGLVVMIGAAPSLDGLQAAWPSVRIERSPAARRKSDAWRRDVRQAAFAASLRGAVDQAAPESGDVLTEGAFEGAARPVCALADAAGEDMVLAVLTAPGIVHVPPPPRPAVRLRLGRMWAAPEAEGWRLLERLGPAWRAPVAPPPTDP